MCENVRSNTWQVLCRCDIHRLQFTLAACWSDQSHHASVSRGCCALLRPRWKVSSSIWVLRRASEGGANDKLKILQSVMAGVCELVGDSKITSTIWRWEILSDTFHGFINEFLHLDRNGTTTLAITLVYAKWQHREQTAKVVPIFVGNDDTTDLAFFLSASDGAGRVGWQER